MLVLDVLLPASSHLGVFGSMRFSVFYREKQQNRERIRVERMEYVRLLVIYAAKLRIQLRIALEKFRDCIYLCCPNIDSRACPHTS